MKAFASPVGEAGGAGGAEEARGAGGAGGAGGARGAGEATDGGRVRKSFFIQKNAPLMGLLKSLRLNATEWICLTRWLLKDSEFRLSLFAKKNFQEQNPFCYIQSSGLLFLKSAFSFYMLVVFLCLVMPCYVRCACAYCVLCVCLLCACVVLAVRVYCVLVRVLCGACVVSFVLCVSFVLYVLLKTCSLKKMDKKPSRINTPPKTDARSHSPSEVSS